MLPVALLGGVAPFVAAPRPAPDAARPLALEARPDGFLARGSGFDALLRPAGELVALRGPVRFDARRRPILPRRAGFTIAFAGAREPRADAREPQAPVRYVSRSGARTAKTFGRVVYRGVYPGVDVAYHGTGGRLQGDWLVAPGADPSRIRLSLRGVDAVAARADGRVAIRARGLGALLGRPLAFQVADGSRRRVAASWRLSGHTLSFALGRYDHALPLVIDPKLEATATVGGDDVDTFLDVDADDAGNLVAVGATLPAGFPRVGGGGFMPAGGFDAVIVTMSPTLQILSTIVIGGIGDDFFQRVDAQAPGEWVISGATTSTDFPVARPQDSTYGGGTCGGGPCVDGLLLVFRGAALQFGTYVGGARDDQVTSIALDHGARGGRGLLVFAGFSQSVEFVRAGGYDDFVGTIDYDALENLQAGSTYAMKRFGGVGNDGVFGLGLRGDSIYAVGGGRSTSQAAPGTYVQYEQPFILYSVDDGRTWAERVYPVSGTFAELDSVEIDADGSAYAGFTGYFPGGDYGACTFGKCQPIGFVKLDSGSFAPAGVSTLVPPAGGGFTLQDVDVRRSSSGAIEALGAAAARWPFFGTLVDPTALAIVVRPGPKIDPPVEFPAGTLAWGTAFAGQSLFVAGVAPENSLPNVRGDADAFISRIGDLGLAGCKCVSISVHASRTHVAGHTTGFTLDWTMQCSGGTGSCEGEISVVPPAGTTVARPARNVHCGPSACSSTARTGSFRVVATSAHAAPTYTFAVKGWCVVNGARTGLRTTRVTVRGH